MHFAIFIPRVVGANPKHLEAVGLGDLLRAGDHGPQLAEIPDRGPDQGPGMLFTWRGCLPAYVPGALQWKPAKADPDKGLAAGRFWWGIDPKSPPTPEDLKRNVQLAGEKLDLGAGQWLVPNCMKLPHKFILDDSGAEAREVIEDFRPVYDRCQWAFNLAKSVLTDRADLPEAECRRYCIEMLALNYRVFRDLVYELGLLTDANWFPLLARTTDFYALIEIEADIKKKRALENAGTPLTPPSSPPGVGPEGSPPTATSPPSATS